ncbi:hypothetical protein M0L20_13690 [Spirosoma sp. RP8]|uniref:Uncharacterized protein n=1 Tax=Spirosoma liriopis TaxID=2937440 RepID=A0ABT0HL63_9BACT|nr:hypothetical protein [Spirosoma liriopis]MCK8492915.1 hypothetical protein [Spirosoma liriopis]
MEVIKLIRPARQPIKLIRVTANQVPLLRPPMTPVRLVRTGGTVVFAGGDSDVSYIAQVPIIDRAAVALTASGLVPYDATRADHAYAFVGIALNSADPGQAVHVRTSGEVAFPAGTLTAGQSFVAGAVGRWHVTRSEGLVFVHKILRAIKADTLLILQQPIFFLT